MIMSPVKTAEPIEMLFRLLTRVGPRNHVLDKSPDNHAWRGNFGGEKGLVQDMPSHVPQSVYSKQFSRWQHCYGADANWDVLDEGAYSRNMSNMTEPFCVWCQCALCQITLTTCCLFFVVKHYQCLQKTNILYFCVTVMTMITNNRQTSPGIILINV